jgi:membrane-associated phospholipid phosphatase
METNESNPHSRRDALIIGSQLISALYTPFATPVVAFALMLFCSFLRIMPMSYKLTVLGLVYSFTVLMPMLSIYLYQKVNGWGLRELGRREKRFVPYGLTILSYLTCLFTMHRLHLPRYMTGIITAALICMLICTALNLKWKVSTHVASSGMMVGGLLSFSFLFQFNPVWWLSFFILLSGMLGTARIILCQHTQMEIFVGFLVGMFCGVTGILFI